MLSFLKNHPFAVEAFFKSSLVLTFAIPKEEIQKLIPECLQLDVFQNKWAFVAVALVDTSGLRPKGFPKILGHSFFLIGYRMFVKYTTSSGKTLRGLYILKSETDKKSMEFLGNIFTHYNYSTTDINNITFENKIEISSQKSNIRLVIEKQDGSILLPINSPFTDWKEARRYAGPLPFTFHYKPESKQVLIVEGVRKKWMPEPINVLIYNLPFIKNMHLNTCVLANAFIINNIPYYWKKGRIDQWRK